MNIVKVEKRNTYITLDFPLEEINYLKHIFDNSTIQFNSEEDDDMPKAVKWLKEEFYPLLDEIMENIKD